MARLSTSIVVAAMVIVATLGVAHGAALKDTTGVRWLGYNMKSDVVGYTNMTQDVCDLEKLVAAGNLTGASSLYLNGKNSMGRDSLRKFMTWATAVHEGEPYWDMLAAYYGPNFTTTLNDTITGAFANKQGALGASLIIITTQVKYMMHEVDAAYRRVAEGNTNATSGPAHNLDEAWAIYSGAHPDNCTTLYELAGLYGDNTGSTHSGAAAATWAINVLFNELQYYALTGNSTVGWYNGTSAALRGEFATMLAQVVLSSAYSSDLYSKCSAAAPAVNQKYIAQAAWWSLAPQLSAWGASKASLAAVDASLKATGALSYAAVKSALLKSATLGRVAVKDVGLPVRALLLPKGCTAALAA